MSYRAVGSRCAVEVKALAETIAIPSDRAISILQSLGFQRVEVDVVALARGCVGRSKFRRGAHPDEAPQVVDCSSLVKWVFGQRGVWLPRRTIQQFALGDPVGLDELSRGDVVFTSGYINYPIDGCYAKGVGHVGMVAEGSTVIHAASRRVGVVEASLDSFLASKEFRGARRYIPRSGKVITFETPPERSVETSDDMRWIVAQVVHPAKRHHSKLEHRVL